jgi:hypothetical protein
MKCDYLGLWYIPIFPSVRLAGILTVSDEEIKLTLHSLVDFRDEPFKIGKDQIDVIGKQQCALFGNLGLSSLLDDLIIS